jgi:hypothetical protein
VTTPRVTEPCFASKTVQRITGPPNSRTEFLGVH